MDLYDWFSFIKLINHFLLGEIILVTGIMMRSVEREICRKKDFLKGYLI